MHLLRIPQGEFRHRAGEVILKRRQLVLPVQRVGTGGATGIAALRPPRRVQVKIAHRTAAGAVPQQQPLIQRHARHIRNHQSIAPAGKRIDAGVGINQRQVARKAASVHPDGGRIGAHLPAIGQPVAEALLRIVHRQPADPGALAQIQQRRALCLAPSGVHIQLGAFHGAVAKMRTLKAAPQLHPRRNHERPIQSVSPARQIQDAAGVCQRVQPGLDRRGVIGAIVCHRAVFFRRQNPFAASAADGHRGMGVRRHGGNIPVVIIPHQ